MGLQKMPVAFTAVSVAAIGIIHEVTEIITHSHNFEFYDAVVNTLGAVIGMMILVLVRKWVREYAVRNFGSKEVLTQFELNLMSCFAGGVAGCGRLKTVKTIEGFK
jgi:glycopeptide antibiotics resistance protein